MTLGNKLIFFLYLIYFFDHLIAEQKITTSPLINIDEIKPSFEELDEKLIMNISKKILKKKIKIVKILIHQANFDRT